MLLEYCVTKQLAGEVQDLKERVVGATLYGRPLDYDTSNDAIVRVKANEVRKRLAMYYSNATAEDVCRIDLPPGSYSPVFEFLGDAAAPAGEPVAEPPTAEGTAAAPAPVEKPLKRFSGRLLVLLAGTVLLGLAIAALFEGRFNPPLDRFWTPFLNPARQILVFLPGRDRLFMPRRRLAELAEAAKSGSNQITLPLLRDEFRVVPNAQMSVQNFRAAVAIASFLGQRGQTARFRLVAEVTADEVRQSSVILVGAYENPWATDLSRNLRYYFESDGEANEEVCWIRDRNSGGEPKWIVRKLWPYGVQEVDYAIVNRTISRSNGQVVISLAGMNGFGTQAAAESITSPDFWHEFAAAAPEGWEKKNLQVVLELRVIRDIPHPPKIVAIHAW